MNKIAELEKKTPWDGSHCGESRQVQCSSDYPWESEVPKDNPAFLPAHYFDLIAGTSTGGLSAIMLGRFQMSVREALAAYEHFGNSVFAHGRWFHERTLLYLGRAKYSTRLVRRTLLEIIQEAMKKFHLKPVIAIDAENEKLALPKGREQQCHTMVVAVKIGENIEDHFIFRSYDHREASNAQFSEFILNRGPACEKPVWYAARATSAAPTWFEPHDDGDAKYIDGAIGANNPSKMALRELDQMFPYKPLLCVSIGTGEKSQKQVVPPKDLAKFERKYSRRQFIKKYLELTKISTKMLTDTKSSLVDALTLARNMNCSFSRYDVPNDITFENHCLGQVPLDEWIPRQSGADTIAKIRHLVGQYLQHSEVQEALSRDAITLVYLRRKRAKTERWERFATDYRYRCCLGESCKETPQLKTRRTIRDHVETSHPEVIEGKTAREKEQLLNELRESELLDGQKTGRVRSSRVTFLESHS